MSVSSARILSSYESCQRSGYWSREWIRHRLSPIEMLNESVRRALTEPSDDPGQNAGEHYVTLAAERGLDLPDSVNTYRCAMNHAATADILVTGIKPEAPWNVPESSEWIPSCLQHGGFLRRFLAVSHWNEERELFERRSWYCLGEVAHFRIPMQMIVANIGHMSGGRRTGHWSKALLHPQRSHLRFKKRSRGTVEGFKETWQPIYREEHDEIDRNDWIQGMIKDDVFYENLLLVNISVPDESECVRIQSIANRRFDQLYSTATLPDLQLSTCFDPISPCPFRYCCHSEPQTGPSEQSGFDRHNRTVGICQKS